MEVGKKYFEALIDEMKEQNGVQQEWWIEHKCEDEKENIKKFNEEYEKRRFHFFELIATYYEDWWD